jgi:hypothetical protein
LLNVDRKHGIIHRLWPGTQHFLLWGDPAFAAAYGRTSSFAGTQGMELMEPLSFKGRKGSGNAEGGRTAYKDASLRPAHDFQKYTYSYRLWGRLLYNPDAKPDVWQRELRHDFGPAAAEMEASLASASRILPLFTTAHCPSAANNNFEPEMYANMPIVTAGPNAEPYADTPTPRRFGTVSPLDAELFLTADRTADELLENKPSGKYSAVEVAGWLDNLAATAEAGRASAVGKLPNRNAPNARRLSIDIAIQEHLGRFFAGKLRASVLHALYSLTGDPAAKSEAVNSYRAARDQWAQLIELTKDVYLQDVSFGIGWWQRGHWSDRLAAIDNDIDTMSKFSVDKPMSRSAADAIKRVLQPPARTNVAIEHTPAKSFKRGQDLPIEARSGSALRLVLHYRITHQAKPWQSVEMTGESGKFLATIPSGDTSDAFPLQYYFSIHSRDGASAEIFPGLGEILMGVPNLSGKV